MRKSTPGITLIELLIVVVVLSIVVGIGVPSYQQYILRANRTDAMTALLRIAAAQERWFINNGQYATTAAELTSAPPAGLGFTAATTERGFYNLSLAPGTAGAAVGYVAFAVADPGERQRDDARCQNFSINERGQRMATDSQGAESTDDCWR